MKKTTWFLLFLLFAISCLDEPECYLLNNNVVGIYFRVMGSNRVDSLGVRKFLINGLPLASTRGGIWDKSHDSVVTHAQVPLDFFNTSTDFQVGTFQNASALDRQLTLGYKVQAQYVSEECGPRYILSDLEVLNSAFDSVRVVNSEPSRDGSSRHIEIFRCPATDTLTLTLNQLSLPATSTTANRSRPSSDTLNGILVDNAATLYADQAKTTIQLPVNLNSTTTSYSFDFATGYESEPIRNLTVNYTATPAVRFRQCGLQTFITDLQISESSFDSVSIARDANGFPLSTLTDPYQTNINVYRCPPTNMLQLAFRRTVAGTPQAASVTINSIVNNYNTEVLYQGVTTSTVRLPLNLDAGSTVFTIDFEGRPSESFTVSYITGPPASTLFKNACSGIKVVRELSVSSASTTVTVTNDAIVFPAVTNLNYEVP